MRNVGSGPVAVPAKSTNHKLSASPVAGYSSPGNGPARPWPTNEPTTAPGSAPSSPGRSPNPTPPPTASNLGVITTSSRTQTTQTSPTSRSGYSPPSRNANAGDKHSKQH